MVTAINVNLDPDRDNKRKDAESSTKDGGNKDGGNNDKTRIDTDKNRKTTGADDHAMHTKNNNETHVEPIKQPRRSSRTVSVKGTSTALRNVKTNLGKESSQGGKRAKVNAKGKRKLPKNSAKVNAKRVKVVVGDHRRCKINHEKRQAKSTKQPGRKSKKTTGYKQVNSDSSYSSDNVESSGDNSRSHESSEESSSSDDESSGSDKRRNTPKPPVKKKNCSRNKQSRNSSKSISAPKLSKSLKDKFMKSFEQSENVSSIEMQRKYILSDHYDQFRDDIKRYHKTKVTSHNDGTMAMIKYRLQQDFKVSKDAILKKKGDQSYVEVVKYEDLCEILFTACYAANHDRVQMRKDIGGKYYISLGVCDWFRQNICPVCSPNSPGPRSTKKDAVENKKNEKNNTSFLKWIEYKNKISLASKLSTKPKLSQQSKQYEKPPSLNADLIKGIHSVCKMTVSETISDQIIDFLGSNYQIVPWGKCK